MTCVLFPDLRVTVTLKTGTIKQTEFFAATPAEVYDALLDPKRHGEFTGSSATGVPRVGGKFTAWEGYISGRNLKLERARTIVQEWKTTEWPKRYPPSTVEFKFREKEGGTELRMTHSNVPAEQLESYRQGWIDFYWNPLKEYFNRKK